MTTPFEACLSETCRMCPTKILSGRQVREALRSYQGAAYLPREVELAAFRLCSSDCEALHKYVSDAEALREGVVR